MMAGRFLGSPSADIETFGGKRIPRIPSDCTRVVEALRELREGHH